MENIPTKTFETYDEIINEAKALTKHLESLYGLRFHGTTKGEHGEYFKVGNETVEISFNTGRFKDEGHQWHPRLPEVANYDAETKSWTVIMTEEQFKELYYKRFGKQVRAEFFNDGRTWGVRITLTAKKAVRTMWQLNRRDLPDQVFILRETKNQLFWTDDMAAGVIYADRKAEVIGRRLFTTKREALEATRRHTKSEIKSKEVELASISATLSYLQALDKELEKAQQADS